MGILIIIPHPLRLLLVLLELVLVHEKVLCGVVLVHAEVGRLRLLFC